MRVSKSGEDSAGYDGGIGVLLSVNFVVHVLPADPQRKRSFPTAVWVAERFYALTV